MTAEEAKLSEDDYMPASLRILNLDFDSGLEHIDYNIERLSKMPTTEGNVNLFDVLNYTVPIITNVCRLVEEPTNRDKDDTFCLQTRLKSCRQEDIEKLESELENIRGNALYQKLKYARNHTVAHIHTSYQEYGATQKALLEDATYLIEREDRLKKLVKSIKSLIHNVEMSVRWKEGKQLNVAKFTIHVP